MFVKIAIRNVKRQIFNYLIYFITVTLTVSMMFALCNLIFSEQVQNYARAMVKLQSALVAIAVVVALIVAIILGYASSFMLKLRKREFGTYLTLGMKRQDILTMFTVENLLIGVVALSSGILFGLILYQGMIGLVARILDLKITLGSYSASGLYLTIALTVLMFLVSTISSGLYLRKVSIYDLLHAEKTVDGTIRHPAIWMLITLACVVAMAEGIVGANTGIQMLFSPDQSESAVTQLCRSIGFLGLGVVFYHIGFAKSAVSFLLKNKTLKNRGTNTFVLRQLSGQMSSNCVLFGIIAFLITATILCTNVCITQKNTIDQSLEHQFPFDLSASANLIDDVSNYDYVSYDPEALENTIQKYAKIRQSITYSVYSSDDGYLHSFTPWSGERYEHLCDHFLAESDFNQILELLGDQKVTLDHEFLILTDTANIANCDFSKAALSDGKEDYTCREVTADYPHLANGYFVAVVPDILLSDLPVGLKVTAYDFNTDEFDVQALYDDLERKVVQEDSKRFPFEIRAYHELGENSFSAILMVGELYMAIVFVFLAVAILTMKLLSGIAEDSKRYDLLYKLGTNQKEQKRALLRQTFSFFAFPIVLPLLLSVPIASICGRAIRLLGFPTLVPQVYLCAVMIAVILMLTQGIYFIATYYVQKQNVIV